MAAQRPTTSSTPLVLVADTCESPVPLALSRHNSMAVVDDVATLRPDNAEKTHQLTRESDRQTRFQSVANSVLEIPNGYRKVEVLILRWHESVDDFKGHSEEIEKLRKIFTDDFGYKCKVEILRNCRTPQLDLNYAILSQVREHSEEDTLHIIYYTGHGFKVDGPGGARLELAATTNWVKKNGYFAPTAFWDEAEQPLLTHALGDVLVILDCCFASTAAVKGRNEGLRSYQLLAATPPEGTTSGPGEKSFTHALCVSLKGLLREAAGGCFPVHQLCEKINSKRLTQASLHWNRLQTYGHSINLGRLEKTQEREKSFEKQNTEQASLLLRLSLKISDLSNTQIERLARRLPEICAEAKIPVRRIDWVTMEQPDQNPGRRLRTAVRTVMKRKSTPHSDTQDPTLPDMRKRTRSDPPSQMDRRALGDTLMPDERANLRFLTPESGGER